MALAVEAQLHSIGELDFIAIVLLVDLDDGHILIVALHIAGDALGDEGGGNGLGVAIDGFPLVIGIEVELGAVVQIDVILHAAMIVIGLNTHYRSIGEILLDESGDGVGQ